MFKFTKTKIPEVIIVEPQVFGDERGFFMETYHKKDFSENGINVEFVQDNHSKSNAGVLRWLHFQTINTQSKLVRVVKGSVYDVAVDLRKWSPTYWQWVWVLLSAENKKQLFIPQGFAHWFLTLEDDTEFVYKCDDYYNPEWDGWILWNSKELNIDWEKYFDLDKIILSEKDKKHNEFKKENFYFWYRELTEKTYIYLDTQNIWQSLKSDWWLIDWKRFMVFLKDKYKAKKVYMFLWFIPKNKDFYNNLKSWWYEIIFKETRELKWKVKWNVDSELVLQAMKDMNKISSAILVSLDWDFTCLVDEWKKYWKLKYVMVTNYKFCSYLLKKSAWDKIFNLKWHIPKFCSKIVNKQKKS